MSTPEPAAGELLPDGSADPVPGRRARRRQEARDRIYNAAIELIMERGFDATTMDDIADRADVGRTTVFNYFPRKTAFISEWALRRRITAMAGVRRHHLDGHPLPEILARYMTELARLSTRTRAETVALMGAALHTTNVLGHSSLAGDMAAIVSRGQATGEVQPDIEPAVGGALVASGYFVILTDWIEVEPPPFDLEDRLLQMVSVICSGLERRD